MKRQDFLIQLSFRMFFFCFLFEKTSYLLPLYVDLLIVHSHSQMFYKTGVLKNFAKFTGK